MLSERLRELAIRYRRDLGVDVTTLQGGGAAGGLAGGLAALGAKLIPGFELVAESVGLDAALGEVDLVITGEGRLDTTSFTGKVVGGVVARAAARDVAVLVVAGDADAGVTTRVPTISLVERFGIERAFAEASACIADVIAAEISHCAWSRKPSRRP
jgi:glycerate kinase